MNHVKQGDIIELSRSSMQALVLSRDFFNRTGLAVLCPIEKTASEDALHFPINTKHIKGVALCEHLKTVDLKTRFYKTISSLTIEQLQDICDAVQDIFAFYPFSIF